MKITCLNGLKYCNLQVAGRPERQVPVTAATPGPDWSGTLLASHYLLYFIIRGWRFLFYFIISGQRFCFISILVKFFHSIWLYLKMGFTPIPDRRECGEARGDHLSVGWLCQETWREIQAAGEEIETGETTIWEKLQSNFVWFFSTIQKKLSLVIMGA